MNLEPVADKWKAFNWEVSLIDGHDFSEILPALARSRSAKGKPHMIIAKTVKGKGVSFMENQIGWHGVAPTQEQAEKAIKELS